MFEIRRLYSDDNCFREVKFDRGINLICGDDSKSGEVVLSKKQNGVGKSLTIELIDFALLGLNTKDSRVSKINNKYLPPNSFVNIHFKYNNVDYIVGRNRNNRVRIKSINDSYEEFEYREGIKKLENVIGFNNMPISLRTYMTFFIKQESYNYKDFIKLYKASQADLLKIHFYLFSLPLDALRAIGEAFKEKKIGSALKTKAKKTLEEANLDVNALKARKNELTETVNTIQEKLDYSNFSSSIDSSSDDLNILESQLAEIRREKLDILSELGDIRDSLTLFDDEIYIDDNDVKAVFEKYKVGLGDIVSKNYTELLRFRDQIVEFKTDIIAEKRTLLENKLKTTNSRLASLSKRADSLRRNLISTENNELVKSFDLYKDRVNELEDYTTTLAGYDQGSEMIEDSKRGFGESIAVVQDAIKETTYIKQSFQQTYYDIHNYVMDDANVNFDFYAKNKFAEESFFQFEVFMDDTGSGGADQRRAVMYDIALIENEYTKPKTLGFIAHDNLIFGRVDKDSSIKLLNYLDTLDESSFQYIATVNADDFNYSKLKSEFSFDVSTKVKLNLTKREPLFWKIYPDFITRKR